MASNGYMGQILKVDLTSGTFETIDTADYESVGRWTRYRLGDLLRSL